jgi:hypothetical protein
VPSKIVQQPVGDYSEIPSLVAMQNGVGLAYGEVRDTAVIKWALVDASNGLVSGPVALMPAPGYVMPEMVAWGPGALLLVHDPDAVSNGATRRLDAVVIAQAGDAQGAPTAIARNPNGLTVKMAAQADHAVAAWINAPSPLLGGATIDLALLARSIP